MEPQPNEPTTDQSQSMANSQVRVATKKVVTKKITKGTKPASGKAKGTKKVTKSKKVAAVKNAQIQNLNIDQSQLQRQIQSQIQSQNPNQNVLPPKMQRQVLPNQVFQKELPVQNREDQINKQYKLKDIVNKTQTMVNYLKALSTTVVKPVIVQEVTTRKPIIAPVDIKTPVNFFEGQPLNEEDLIIQNFFKNTTPVYDEKISNSIIYNDNSILSQSLQYPSQQQQYNTNYLSQSMQYPSQNQAYFKSNTIATSTNNARPQVEKVQLKTVSGEEFNQPKKKVKKKKKGKVMKKSKTQKATFVSKSQNVAATQQNVNAIQQNAAIQQNMVPTQQNVKVIQQSAVIQQNANVVKHANVVKQNVNVIQKNINVSNAANNQALKPQAKVQNITVNNSLKNSFPSPVQQKKIVVQEVEEEDDEKMPRDSIRDNK